MDDNKQYIKFVSEYRKKYDLSMEQLCFGICDRSNYSSFEAGKSALSYAVRDRLLERLGVCTDDFYNFVDIEEYNKWLRKQDIVYMIINRDLETAEKLLEESCCKGFAENSFDKQFYLRMKSFIEICKKSDAKKVAHYLEECLECSLPDFSIERINEYAISVLELDTILDYLFYSGDDKQEHYLSIIAYIRQERFNIKARMVVLAKAVIYYLTIKERQVLVEMWYPKDKDKAIELIELALTYARVKKSSSYLYELIQWRIVFLEQKTSQDNDEKWIMQLQNSIKWINALQYLSNYSKRDIHTIDTAHLYCAANVESINEIIRRRKEMMNLTNVKIAQGICGHRVIGNAIKKVSTPQKDLAGQILDRLRYTNCLNKNCFNASSIEEMKLSELFRFYTNYRDTEKMEKAFLKMKAHFENGDIYSEQFLEGWEIYVRYLKKEISKDECIELYKSVIEKTVMLDSIYNSNEISLSIHEFIFLNHYVKRLSKEKLEKSLLLLGKMADEWLGNSFELAKRTSLFILVETLQNKYGDLGYYDLSNEYSNKGIQMYMNIRQLPGIAGMFYNMWWNDNEKNKTIDKDLEGCIHQLSLCKDLAHLTNGKSDYEFYCKKIEFIRNSHPLHYHDPMNYSEELCEWIDLVEIQG